MIIRSEYLKQLSPYGGALLITMAISWLASGGVASLDARLTDTAWQWIAAESKVEQRVVIVDIDEASIARYGAWPWSRKQMAELSAQITEQGASLQIFDMVFAAKKQQDDLLVAQLKSESIVLSQILAIDADDNTQVGVLATGTKNVLCNGLYPQANAYIANNKQIGNAVSSVGHITPSVDKDGIVRKMPAYICRNGKAYPALALAALATAMAEPVNYVLEQTGGWLSPGNQLKHTQLPEIIIPVSDKGEILLPWWLSRNSLLSISAADMLEGNVPKKMLKGAWVLIGSTAFGVGDAVSTPQAAVVGGVEVHAQLLSALLDNKIPYQPQAVNTLLYICMAGITLIMWLVSRLKGRLLIYGAPVAGVVIALGVIIGSAVILKTQAILIPPALAVIYTLLTGIMVTVKGYSQNWSENQRLYLNLSSYLPEHAAKWIVKQNPNGSMSAHHEDAFVLYVDLRNFSNWCNQLPAEQTGAILHTFYTVVTEVVQQHGGQTEKYVGDAVMCVWRNQHDSVLQAAQALVSLIDQQFGEQSKQANLPPLAVGIGIEYGKILVGSLGPAQRREYTVIGKTVTTAMRLQEMTGDLALPILIGEQARNKWGETIALETQGEFLLIGAQQAMELFSPK